MEPMDIALTPFDHIKSFQNLTHNNIMLLFENFKRESRARENARHEAANDHNAVIARKITPVKEIIISEIPVQTTLEDLRIRFSVYGNIQECYLLSEKEACIIFDDGQSGNRAINEGKKKQIYLHNKMLKVRSKLELKVNKENTDNGKNSKKLQIYLENHRGDKSINELPDDCLLLIFEYISFAEKFNLRKVCKRWCTITNKSLQTVKYLHLITPKLATCCECSKFHDLDSCPNAASNNSSQSEFDFVAFSNMYTLAMDCTNLTKLIIRSSIHDEGILTRILVMNQNLKHIEIHNNRSIKGKSLIHLPKDLHTFIVKPQCELNSELLCAALKRLENLKYLELNDYFEYNVFDIFEEYCQNLEYFKLHLLVNSPRNDKRLFPITNLKHLKDLRICGYTLTSTFFSELNRNCQKLSHLEIDGYFQPSVFFSLLPNLQNSSIIIRHIVINRNENLYELHELSIDTKDTKKENLVKIIQNFPDLRYIRMCISPKIRHTWLLNKIRIISASRCNNVTLQVYFDNRISKEYIIHNGEYY